MKRNLLCLSLIYFFSSCNEQTATVENQEQQVTSKPQSPTIELVISISDRQLSVLQSGDTLRKYDVSVGTSEYPTPTGDFKIHRIDWNPDWTPPDSEWTEGKEHTPPGHKDNPMGRARIVYQMPYTIHGTKNLNSLGGAESHGSVRMANADVIELAKLIMKESGTEKPDDWYQRVLGDSTTMVSVDLENQIPLTNKK